MNVSSDWFIAPRVRRLQRLVHLLPEKSPGSTGIQLTKTLRPQIDGPREEIPHLVHVLARLGLLHVQSDRYHLSLKGRRIVTLSEDRARTELAELIIQSGFLHDQVRQLIEATTMEDDGLARSRVGPLRHSAPQLLGLLRAWPGIVGSSFVRIPSKLFAAIDTPWSLVPLPSLEDGTNKSVGSRAEAYSFHFLRLGSERPDAVAWVARDDEGLGYDIEDRSSGETNRVEVKGSQRDEVRFFLSANEHQVAHHDPGNYELHFWGEINLNRDPNSEFSMLRERGFPLIFEDLAAHLADHRLAAVPTKYRVTLGSALIGAS